MQRVQNFQYTAHKTLLQKCHCHISKFSPLLSLLLFLFSFLKLGHSCVTVLCSCLLNSEVNQSHASLCPSLLDPLPSQPSSHPSGPPQRTKLSSLFLMLLFWATGALYLPLQIHSPPGLPWETLCIKCSHGVLYLMTLVGSCHGEALAGGWRLGDSEVESLPGGSPWVGYRPCCWPLTLLEYGSSHSPPGLELVSSPPPSCCSILPVGFPYPVHPPTDSPFLWSSSTALLECDVSFLLDSWLIIRLQFQLPNLQNWSDLCWPGRLIKAFMCAKSIQSCPTLCNHMDPSPPGSSVHGILQARILEWVAVPSSRGSSWPRDWTCVSYVSCISRQVLYP